MKNQNSAFSRIMQRGQRKVRTTSSTQQLLATLSDRDHKNIAAVIAKWLSEDAQT